MKFKIQLPLASSEASPPALIYNEDRSIISYAPISGELMSLFEGRGPKIYVEGEYDCDDDTIIIDDIIEEQVW